VSKYAPVPRCNWPGHCWEVVRNDPTTTWLAGYKTMDIIESRGGEHKYVFLDAGSVLKGLADQAKFDKARKLQVRAARVIF
jgi:hypothetical protein